MGSRLTRDAYEALLEYALIHGPNPTSPRGPSQESGWVRRRPRRSYTSYYYPSREVTRGNFDFLVEQTSREIRLITYVTELESGAGEARPVVMATPSLLEQIVSQYAEAVRLGRVTERRILRMLTSYEVEAFLDVAYTDDFLLELQERDSTQYEVFLDALRAFLPPEEEEEEEDLYTGLVPEARWSAGMATTGGAIYLVGGTGLASETPGDYHAPNMWVFDEGWTEAADDDITRTMVFASPTTEGLVAITKDWTISGSQPGVWTTDLGGVWDEQDTVDEREMCNCTLPVIGYDGSGNIVVYAKTLDRGGQIALYNLDTKSWTIPWNTESDHFREGAVGLCPDENSLIVFGGCHPTTHVPQNGVWKYNLATDEWSTLTSEDIPARYFPAITTDYAGNIYVFGGQGADEALNDLWKYNITSQEWTELDSGSGPSARSRCSMLYSGGDLYMFGGGTEAADPPDYQTDLTDQKDDLWRFNIAAGSWSRLIGS